MFCPTATNNLVPPVAPTPTVASEIIGAMMAGASLHEIHAACADRTAAMAFSIGVAAGCSSGPILLIECLRRQRPSAQLHAAGLAGLGIAPSRILAVDTPAEVDLLRAAHDGARCHELAAVVVASTGRLADYDLTASRRLLLAAEESGVAILLLRIDADPRPSAARTRWQICSAPSSALEARAPGLPAIDAELLRRRGGPAGQRFTLVWDRHHGRFVEAPVPGDLAALPVGGTGAASVPGHLRAA